jgi:hypothetical protein
MKKSLKIPIEVVVAFHVHMSNMEIFGNCEKDYNNNESLGEDHEFKTSM